MTPGFKGTHFPQEIMLMGVRWYVAYPLSYRHVEELMAEGGMSVDHATINRWVIKYSPHVEQDHRAVKRITRPMLGLKSFASAQPTLVGIELMHMIRKGQLEVGQAPGAHRWTVLRLGSITSTLIESTHLQ
jgi:transposase-like protein